MKKLLATTLIAAGVGALAAGVYKLIDYKKNKNYSIDNGQVLDLDSDPFFNKDLPHIEKEVIPGQAEMEVNNHVIAPNTPAKNIPTQTSH